MKSKIIRMSQLLSVIFLLVVFSSYSQSRGSGRKIKDKKPNILLIYTDDHRFSGVHTLGNQPVRTPHMDELANQGIAFTNTYLMGSFSGATCGQVGRCCSPENSFLMSRKIPGKPVIWLSSLNIKNEMKTKGAELGDNKDTTGEKYDFWDYYE